MVHIVLIQGAGVGASDTFVADIERHLASGDTIEAPIMPLADDPAAARWLPAIGATLLAQRAPFVAVGHSLGGSSLLQWLGANPVPKRLVAMIGVAAPYWGDGGWSQGEFSLPSGAAERLSMVPHIHLLGGSEDETVPTEHLALYAGEVPGVSTMVMPGMDHGWAGGGAALMACIKQYAD